MTIISPSGWLARYVARDGTGTEDLPVAYFRRVDDEAMVIVPGEPRPRPAVTVPGFKGLLSCPRRAAAIPSAPGWLLHAQDDQGNEHATPIIGWVVDEQGDGTPLVVYERNGRCYAAPQLFSDYTVHSPVRLGLPLKSEPQVDDSLPAAETGPENQINPSRMA